MTKQKSTKKATPENHVIRGHILHGRATPRFAQDFSGETKTQQHFTEAQDVNNIVAAYDRTGIDPYAERLTKQRFGNGEYQTFQDHMNVVAEARSTFETLPQEIKDQYGHVEAYLEAVSDEFVSRLNDPETFPQAASQEPPEAAEKASTPDEKDAG